MLPQGSARVYQNIPFGLAGFSMMSSCTSQCSTILPFSSLKMSTMATPRVAGRLLRRVRDFAAVAGHAQVDAKIADAALTRRG